MTQTSAPYRSPFEAEEARIENLIERFVPWFRELSPTQQNTAFLMTSGLADAMARETSRFSPQPGFFNDYVRGSKSASVTQHQRTYGVYREHDDRLEPELTPHELGAIGWYLFVEPVHQAPTTCPD